MWSRSIKHFQRCLIGLFKLTAIVCKCLNGLTPVYQADECMPVSSVSSRRPLRFADTTTLVPGEQERYSTRETCSLQCSRLELSARSPPSLIADFGNVCLLVFLPELAHLRTSDLALYKLLLLLSVFLGSEVSSCSTEFNQDDVS